MSAPAREQTESEWSRVERAIERFEDAWRSGQPPDIGEFLRAETTVSDGLLVELIHADLECRLKAGEAARVETYLERFPAVAGDAKAVVGLIAAEYKHRQRRLATVTPEEYFQRFPHLCEELSTRLAPPKGESPSSLTCPNCHHAIAISSGSATEAVTCTSCGSSFRFDLEPTTAFAEGSQPKLGPFALLEVVGQGAFGTVYRARDTRLDRIVAVKVPRGGRWLGPAEIDRFTREARSAAQLVHPGIVPVYDVGRDSALPYIVSAYVDGKTLADAVALRRFGFRETAELIAQVAEALDYAHRRGVVHRDLKPSNVMLGRLEGTGADVNENARAFVMDFGLARRDDGEISVTMEGQVLGTPAYMSPEQARGEGHQAGGGTDIYSVGVILYEMLTGELPFRGVVRMVLHQILHDEPRPLRQLNDKIPRDLETITLKCLAKEPSRRYASAGALYEDLRRHLNGEPIAARPAGRAERLWRWAKRNPRVAVLSSTVAVLLVALAVGGMASALLINQQKGKAVKAQEDAEANAALALGALEKLIFEVQDHMEDLPAKHHVKENLLNVAVAELQKVTGSANGERATRSTLAAHEKLVVIFLLLGEQDKAWTQSERYRSLAEKAHEADPADPVARRAVIRAILQQTRVKLRVGDVTSSRTLGLEAIKLAESALDTNPRDAEARLDVAIGYFRLGEAENRAKRFADARKAFHQAIDCAAPVVMADPKNVEAKTSLALMYEGLSDTEFFDYDFLSAADAGREALRLRQELVAASPGRIRPRRNLAFAYEKAAGAFHGMGNYHQSLEYRHKGREVREALAEADPQDVNLQLELASSYGNIANDYLMPRQFALALPWFERAVQILRNLEAKGKLADRTQFQGWLRQMETNIEACRSIDQIIADLDFCLKQPKDRVRYFLHYRAMVLAERGEHEEAVRTMGQMSPNAPDAAWFYALCAKGIGGRASAGQLSAEDQALQQQYVQKCLEIVRGLLMQGKVIVHYASHPDWVVVQQDPEFQKLVHDQETARRAAANSK